MDHPLFLEEKSLSTGQVPLEIMVGGRESLDVWKSFSPKAAVIQLCDLWEEYVLHLSASTRKAESATPVYFD